MLGRKGGQSRGVANAWVLGGRRERGRPGPWPGRTPPPQRLTPRGAAAAAATGPGATGSEARPWLGGRTDGQTHRQTDGSRCSRRLRDLSGQLPLRPAPAGSGYPGRRKRREEEEEEGGRRGRRKASSRPRQPARTAAGPLGTPLSPSAPRRLLRPARPEAVGSEGGVGVGGSLRGNVRPQPSARALPEASLAGGPPTPPTPPTPRCHVPSGSSGSSPREQGRWDSDSAGAELGGTQ